MFSNRSNPPLCQVSMFNTSPISRKCDITVRTCKLLRHIIPLEEIDRNCLQLSYALFFGLIHISLTFSERDVGTALSYRDKKHFGASISKKTNFKSRLQNSPYFCVFKYARAVKQKVWNEAENRAILGRDAKNTDCPFCIRYIRSNYPLLPATGNSHWLNFDASCHQAVK